MGDVRQSILGVRAQEGTGKRLVAGCGRFDSASESGEVLSANLCLCVRGVCVEAGTLSTFVDVVTV